MSTSMRSTTTSTSAKPNKPGWRRKDIYTAWAFSTPALILLLIFLVIPFFVAIDYSLTNARLVSGPLHTKFVGLSNYIQMLGDSSLHQALLNNSLFGIVIPNDLLQSSSHPPCGCSGCVVISLQSRPGADQRVHPRYQLWASWTL